MQQNRNVATRSFLAICMPSAKSWSASVPNGSNSITSFIWSWTSGNSATTRALHCAITHDVSFVERVRASSAVSQPKKTLSLIVVSKNWVGTLTLSTCLRWCKDTMSWNKYSLAKKTASSYICSDATWSTRPSPSQIARRKYRGAPLT